MIFQTLTLTCPILLDHSKIRFCEYKPLQRYSRILTSGFLTQLKTSCVIKHLHLYVLNKGTYMTKQFVLRDEEIFRHYGKKIITGGGLNTAALGLENKNFSGEDQWQRMNI